MEWFLIATPHYSEYKKISQGLSGPKRAFRHACTQLEALQFLRDQDEESPRYSWLVSSWEFRDGIAPILPKEALSRGIGCVVISDDSRGVPRNYAVLQRPINLVGQKFQAVFREAIPLSS